MTLDSECMIIYGKCVTFRMYRRKLKSFSTKNPSQNSRTWKNLWKSKREDVKRSEEQLNWKLLCPCWTTTFVENIRTSKTTEEDDSTTTQKKNTHKDTKNLLIIIIYDYYYSCDTFSYYSNHAFSSSEPCCVLDSWIGVPYQPVSACRCQWTLHSWERLARMSRTIRLFFERIVNRTHKPAQVCTNAEIDCILDREESPHPKTIEYP